MRRIAKYLHYKSISNDYHAFIKSNFQYANIVWHITGTPNVILMEKIERRALRIVFNDYSLTYAELSTKAKYLRYIFQE